MLFLRIMQKEFVLPSLDKIDTVAAEILDTFNGYKVFLLEGDLGAGKTTLTQAFCKYLKVNDDVVSPTYTIINEYLTSTNEFVYHADLYRLNSLHEAVETGIEDYLYSKRYCFIEWPQIISEILPFKFVKLVIRNQNDQSNSGRKIIAETNG